MKARDALAARALRSAISAIENAEALGVEAHPVPTGKNGPGAGALLGLGAGDVERRLMIEAEVVAIVRGEIKDRQTAATQYELLGRLSEAHTLRAEWSVLEYVLAES